MHQGSCCTRDQTKMKNTMHPHPKICLTKSLFGVWEEGVMWNLCRGASLFCPVSLSMKWPRLWSNFICWLPYYCHLWFSSPCISLSWCTILKIIFWIGQACVKRVEDDETGTKHCTGQFFDYWGCVDKCVSLYLISPTSKCVLSQMICCTLSPACFTLQ